MVPLGVRVITPFKLHHLLHYCRRVLKSETSWSPCLVRPIFTGMVKSHSRRKWDHRGKCSHVRFVASAGYIRCYRKVTPQLLPHPGGPSLPGEGLQHFHGPPRKNGEKFHCVSKLDWDCHLLTHSWNDKNCAMFPEKKKKTEQKQDKS